MKRTIVLSAGTALLIVSNMACFRAEYATTSGSALTQKSQTKATPARPSSPAAPSGSQAEDAPPAQVDVPITNFQEVISGKIYRGARPETVGMEALAQIKVKTDIDLENDDDAIAAEKKDAADLGISFVSKPMSGFWTPNDSEVNEVISLMEDQRNYPIFVHCQHGEDRTGMIVGVFEVSAMGKTPEEAYEQAVDFGFHWELLPLYDYFQDKINTAYSLLHPSN